MVRVVRFLPSVQMLPQPKPAMVRILGALEYACRQNGVDHDLTVTCGTEGHGPTDPHTLGEALDVKTLDLTADQILNLMRVLNTELTGLFYLQYEANTKDTIDPKLQGVVIRSADATAPHMHIQRAKGTVYPPVA